MTYAHHRLELTHIQSVRQRETPVGSSEDTVFIRDLHMTVRSNSRLGGVSDVRRTSRSNHTVMIILAPHARTITVQAHPTNGLQSRDGSLDALLLPHRYTTVFPHVVLKLMSRKLRLC